MDIAHGFVDGGYLREVAKAAQVPLLNPFVVIFDACNRAEWKTKVKNTLKNLIYYDASPKSNRVANNELLEYWRALAPSEVAQPELEFRRNWGLSQPRQDTLNNAIAEDVLRCTRHCNLAILVARGSGLEVAVEEAKRQGLSVIIAGARDLGDKVNVLESVVRVADLFVRIPSKWDSDDFCCYLPD